LTEFLQERSKILSPFICNVSNLKRLSSTPLEMLVQEKTEPESEAVVLPRDNLSMSPLSEEFLSLSSKSASPPERNP
jgi:hypothetical protein